MNELHVLYIDGHEETFVIPDGMLVRRTPDLIIAGPVEIERAQVRRVTTTRPDVGRSEGNG